MTGLGIVYGLLNLIEFVIAFYLIFPMVIYLLWKAKGYRKAEFSSTDQNRDYAVIITAYQQTELIPDVVRSLLSVNYSNFSIYIVADNCVPSDDLRFLDDRITVLFPEKVLASNISSHFYAIEHFKRAHDVLLIIDSDNIAHPELINELNLYFDQGFDAVQGVRMAKNLDTTIACLDAARDVYYHFYDGEVLFDLGSSATLAGSGMAFRVEWYKKWLGNLSISGAGFDKVLQHLIVSDNKRIAFSKNAIVYDQKTTNKEQLVHQRSRWIGTWFRYFKLGFSIFYKGIINPSINQLLFGLVLLRPPLFIFLLLGILLILLNLFLNVAVAFMLTGSLVIFILSFLIPILSPKTDKRIYNALLFIPVFIFYQLISLVKSFLPNKSNIATKHSHQKK